MQNETNKPAPENSANNAAKPLTFLQQWRKRITTQEQQENEQQAAEENPKRTSRRTPF